MLKNLETPGDHGCTGTGDVSAELKDRAKARSFCLSKPAGRAQRKKLAAPATGMGSGSAALCGMTKLGAFAIADSSPPKPQTFVIPDKRSADPEAMPLRR
jgi:hypothetical protein